MPFFLSQSILFSRDTISCLISFFSTTFSLISYKIPFSCLIHPFHHSMDKSPVFSSHPLSFSAFDSFCIDSEWIYSAAPSRCWTWLTQPTERKTSNEIPSLFLSLPFALELTPLVSPPTFLFLSLFCFPALIYSMQHFFVYHTLILP